VRPCYSQRFQRKKPSIATIVTAISEIVTMNPLALP
jgi:hypothetical protein